MRINDVELLLLAGGSGNESELDRTLLVRIATQRGIEGWGEAASSWRPAAIESLKHGLPASLSGHNLFDVEEALSLDVLAGCALASAVEMALWDAIGRALGQPLCHLWGGAFRHHIPVAARLPAASDTLASVARELSERGFHSQIVNCSGCVDDDVAALGAVGEATGGLGRLRLDGAGRYQLDQARELCRRVGEGSLEVFLDPLADDDLGRFRDLQRQVHVPLGVARSIAAPRDVFALARTVPSAHVVIDPARVGGLAQARRCIEVADAGGLTASARCGPSLGLATAAVVQLAASTPALSTACEFVSAVQPDRVVIHPLEAADGILAVPPGPGLGVEVDRGLIEPLLIG